MVYRKPPPRAFQPKKPTSKPKGKAPTPISSVKPSCKCPHCGKRIRLICD